MFKIRSKGVPYRLGWPLLGALILTLTASRNGKMYNGGIIAKDTSENHLYVPVPKTVETTPYLIGAFRCPLWNDQNRPDCWEPIKSFPERKPLLGWYNESNPEVTDWEIKFAVEHGISFFVECWYRKKDNLGKPVEAELDHWLHQGLFESRYRDQVKFMILWENVNKISSGVASAGDLMENLMPYWIDQFFTQPNYLLIDNKPVLMVYGYQKFIDDLGGEARAVQAIDSMKRTCVRAGFDGLWLIAEHHLPLNRQITAPKKVGFDAISSYHWPSFSGLMPTPPLDQNVIIDHHVACWDGLKQITGLPAITTISMGWDSTPWGNTYYKGKWHLEPNYFQTLCARAKDHIDLVSEESPLSNILFVDNWNEFGEGHYIFPHERYGFGYLDAIRSIFSRQGMLHTDIVPQDIGLGPYEE